MATIISMATRHLANSCRSAYCTTKQASFLEAICSSSRDRVLPRAVRGELSVGFRGWSRTRPGVRVCARSSEDSSAGDANVPIGRGGGGPEGASATVQELLDLLTSGEAGKVKVLDALLNSLTEAQQDEWYAAVAAEPTWTDEEELRQLENFLEGPFDACALRVLLLNGPPMVGRTLSSLTIAPGELLQRILLLGATGEEVVLAWRLVMEESLEPVYKGIKVRDRWAVKSVKGEPAEPLPQDACPTASPEAVVAAQLAALAELDVQRCFNFASPANKAAIGDNLSRFAEMLQVPAYSILLGHKVSNVLSTKQLTSKKFVCVCGVEGTETAPGSESLQPRRAVFIWILSLQKMEGSYLNCWMTDAVYRGDDSAMLFQAGGS